MIDFALLGAGGRMGLAIANLIAQRDDCRVSAGIDANTNINLGFKVYKSLEEMQEKPDVLIDFSHPDASRKALIYCAKNNLPIVVCTTGLNEETHALMKTSAIDVAVFYSANMSLGINLMTELAQKAQEVLQGFDIEIVEKHHHNKLDAPSGTALMLADAINENAGGKYTYQYNRQILREKRKPNEIGIHAVRGGSIVGEHEVIYAGPDEVLTLSHTAYSRDVFANGAVAAALFLAGKPAGTYNMRDVLKLS